MEYICYQVFLMVQLVRDDRRGTPRTPAVLPVAIESDVRGARHGVTRDLSAKGLLVVTPTRFAKGDRIKIRMNDLDVMGRVTRVDENPISSPELWRYRVGVALDEELPGDLVTER